MISSDPVTVEKYIGMLEQAFIVFRLYSLSRNHWNALIANFNPLTLRQDTGALWENLMVSERMKHIQYNDIYCNRYFWRTNQQQEIDYVEEREGKLFAYGFKWSKKAKPKFPSAFINAYPGSEVKLITPDNYEEFVA